jgi:hypothetical protein
MAVKGRPSINKRQKEMSRKEERDRKDARRAQRKTERESRPPTAPGADPDIAHIVPGPQPIPEE